MTREPTGMQTPRSRRWLLSRAGLAAAAVAVPTVWIARSAAADDIEAAATIDLDMVLLAAQLDPPKADTEVTP